MVIARPADTDLLVENLSEQHADDDGPRQLGHLVEDVERPPVLGRYAPAVQHGVRALGDQRDEGGHPVRSEERPEQMASAEPVPAVDRRETGAEERHDGTGG
jgi:hypothetical protein